MAEVRKGVVLMALDNPYSGRAAKDYSAGQGVVKSQMKLVYRCIVCSQQVNARDLGQVFHHEGRGHKRIPPQLVVFKPKFKNGRDPMRLIATKTEANRTVKVYYNAPDEEYVCKLFIDGQWYKRGAADYFTPDKQDAFGTQLEMLKDPAAQSIKQEA